jgi:oligogalacturonide lyase
MALVGGTVIAATRRAFLGSLTGSVALAADSKRVYPAERARYADPATEFEVHRLTDPAHSCYLPPTYARIFGRRGDFLLYAADRGGSLQAWSLDLKSFESRQLTEAARLDRASLTLTADDRSLCYIDGAELRVTQISSGRTRTVYSLTKDSHSGGVSCIPYGPSAIFVDAQTRLMMANLNRSESRAMINASAPIFDPSPRPRRASVLYRTGSGDLWLAHFDGARNFRLKTTPGGRNGPARWAPDGRTVLYLHYPGEGKQHRLREHNPDTSEDREIAPTTQFVQFSSNSDASVFVGASGSKASPYVLLLLRAARRELTLCEHRCPNPTDVAPVFSPNSQRIFFQSERHGKPALYSMTVDKLVEKTEEEAEPPTASRS